MCSDDSVMHWFEQIQEGDSVAARAVWERYFPKLVRLAREKLRGASRRMADEEDVAASVMESFFRAAQKGRFPDLADRHDLWRLLLRMTARKAVDLKRHEGRERRGAGRVRGESAFDGTGPADKRAGLAEVIGDVPTPDFAAIMAEQCQRLLEQLDDAELEAVALAKLEGYTNREIAKQFKCSEKTIERQLTRIRKRWRKTDGHEAS